MEVSAQIEIAILSGWKLGEINRVVGRNETWHFSLDRSVEQNRLRFHDHVPQSLQRGHHAGYSDIVRKLQEVHKKLFSEPAKLIAMHAGLECGVIGEKYPGMQMVSFGPTIVDPHSPNERVQIPSVESFWNYLKLVLESL